MARKVVPQIKLKTATELAVEAIDAEWMKECQGLGPAPENSITGLLTDSTDAMTLLAECRNRHNSFVRYLRPIVEAEKKK